MYCYLTIQLPNHPTIQVSNILQVSNKYMVKEDVYKKEKKRAEFFIMYLVFSFSFFVVLFFWVVGQSGTAIRN